MRWSIVLCCSAALAPLGASLASAALPPTVLVLPFEAPAAAHRDLGFAAVRLLTNNPDKVAQLAERGIEVTERVEHSFAANRHNRFYLETKASRSGHLLRLPDLPRRGAA